MPKQNNTSSLTPGVEDAVAKFIQHSRDNAAGKATASPFTDANPLQLPTAADVEYFVQAMDAEAARIDAEAIELRKRRLAEIAAKDAQIASLNRNIEAATARYNDQEAEIERRASLRGKVIETARKIAPKLDTSNLSEDAIRREVVQGRFGADAVAGKTQAYIDCRFDFLADEANADPFAALVKDGIATGINDGKAQADRAYADMVSGLTNGWKATTH
ncbi:hypothetical protein [Pararhizobium sp. O133]|uniref:hypothetical protein n=1 Tax=Pararhizobium sp. O133 TaxID=3449278 RepID=UPI003F683A00